MPFVFSREALTKLPKSELLIEDRRDNPVRNRKTLFRLAQQNMIAYTYSEGVPGFASPGMNGHPFAAVVDQAAANARAEGTERFGSDFSLSPPQIAKVLGDIFEVLEGAIHWNAACRWNRLVVDGTWDGAPRYPRPAVKEPSPDRQVVSLALPRRYDWVRLLEPGARREIEAVLDELRKHQLGLPTSTPDLVVVALPEKFRSDIRFRTELTSLRFDEQRRLNGVYAEMEGLIGASDVILAVAVKKSLRSDRLYQPLYEANIMQLLLEGRLGAPLVEFEVHTLDSIGTRAKKIYEAASLAAVATRHAEPHRAVRELYEPPNAQDLVKRFLSFLEARTKLPGPP
jgi:hypothetical protein